MVESAISELANKIKHHISVWAPNNQERVIDYIMEAWKEHNWGDDELITLEIAIEKLFINLDTDSIDDAILDKLDTLFGAFDNKSPANAIKKKVLGKLDRAGGNMLDTT